MKVPDAGKKHEKRQSTCLFRIKLQILILLTFLFLIIYSQYSTERKDLCILFVENMKRPMIIDGLSNRKYFLKSVMEKHWENFNRANISEFFPRITDRERQLLLDLLENWLRATELIQLRHPWFISGGSVLGAIRHNTLIPWDDDIDILVHSADLSRIEKFFDSRGDSIPSHKSFQVYSYRTKIKLFANSKQSTLFSNSVGSRKLSQFPWKWPYLDISGYEISNGTLKEIESSYGRNYSYSLSDILPVSFHVFDKFLVPIPNNPFAYLRKTYGDNLWYCRTNPYSHKYEKIVDNHSNSVKCKEIKNFYPFNKHEFILLPASNYKYKTKLMTPDYSNSSCFEYRLQNLTLDDIIPFRL